MTSVYPMTGDRWRRAGRDALISAGGVGIVLVAIVSMDDRVRGQVSRILHGSPSSNLTDGVKQLLEAAAAVFAAAWQQGSEHTALTMFGVVAAVLVLSMLRI